MTKVAGPYMVHDQRQLVGKLMCGKWLMYRHEWLGDGCDLVTWKLRLLEVAEAAGVEIDFFDIPGKDMTLVANDAALPGFDQVEESVDAMVVHRWMEREIGSEFEFLTGREDSYAAWRCEP